MKSSVQYKVNTKIILVISFERHECLKVWDGILQTSLTFALFDKLKVGMVTYMLYIMMYITGHEYTIKTCRTETGIKIRYQLLPKYR
jgi:hypothetical protein